MTLKKLKRTASASEHRMARFLAMGGAATSLSCLLMSAPSAAPPAAAPPRHVKGFELPNHVLQVNWDQLLPPDSGTRASQTAPAPVHTYLGEAGPAAMQTGSAAVNSDLEGLTLRMPGYIVPLDENAEGLVTEFFLVPYYGACIHVPPPPPNQMVYVKPAKAVLVKDTLNAYWITGVMHIQVRNTHIASSSYSMKVEKVEAYE